MSMHRRSILTAVATGALALMSAAVSAGTWEDDVFTNVPETAGYRLVYSLQIPVVGPGWNGNPVGYTTNNSATIAAGSFSRIGYYLELESAAVGMQWVYASFDAAPFSANPTKLGVPTTGSGEFYHYGMTGGQVANMNVFSNVAGIVTGTGITTGNVEFWPSNYGASNDYGVPGASGSTYDFGDGGAGTGNGYGVMQIANYGASQMLLSINHWGTAGGTLDIGIGNQPAGNPDWTFASNAASYTARNLEIVVDPIPEPATLSLVALGALALLGRRRK